MRSRPPQNKNLTWTPEIDKLSGMKMATTPAAQRRWMQQWREAAIMLDEVKRYELANLTQRDAWRQIEDLLSLVPHFGRLSRTSGLVQQQAWFHKRKRT
jgi:hypothetical protein